jgi:hypothetical protein
VPLQVSITVPVGSAACANDKPASRSSIDTFRIAHLIRKLPLGQRPVIHEALHHFLAACSLFALAQFVLGVFDATQVDRFSFQIKERTDIRIFH